MDILSIGILLFVLIESANIVILYKRPGEKLGNGVGVFKSYEKSKEDKEMYEFVKYMVNWVAGVKLIFVLLLIVIALKGSEDLKVWVILALIVSIMTFYVKLYPIIKGMDKNGELVDKGYSKKLFWMITIILIVFVKVLILYFLDTNL